MQKYSKVWYCLSKDEKCKNFEYYLGIHMQKIYKWIHINCNDKLRMIPFGDGGGTQGIFPTVVIFYFLIRKGGIKVFANYSLRFLYVWNISQYNFKNKQLTALSKEKGRICFIEYLIICILFSTSLTPLPHIDHCLHRSIVWI